MEKRKYKKVPTSELLDLIGKDIPYTQDKQRDKQNDYKEELEERSPFGVLIRKIERQDKEIREHKKVITLLMNHTHSKEGKAVVSIEKTDEAWSFK